MHFKKFIHTNLTPKNIFYDGENVLIMGWENVVNVITNQNLKTSPLPKFAQAPEIGSKKYEYQIDVWSLGLILALFCPKRD